MLLCTCIPPRLLWLHRLFFSVFVEFFFVFFLFYVVVRWCVVFFFSFVAALRTGTGTGRSGRLHKIARAVSGRGMGKSIEVIGHARIPIVKFIHSVRFFAQRIRPALVLVPPPLTPPRTTAALLCVAITGRETGGSVVRVCWLRWGSGHAVWASVFCVCFGGVCTLHHGCAARHQATGLPVDICFDTDSGMETAKMARVRWRRRTGDLFCGRGVLNDRAERGARASSRPVLCLLCNSLLACSAAGTSFSLQCFCCVFFM